MYINNKWYTESELNAYIKKLESTISELEDKHWNECRQIAHYEEELTEAKRLLKFAIEIFWKFKEETMKLIGENNDKEYNEVFYDRENKT